MHYRCDTSKKQTDGATVFYAMWMGGPTLAKIKDCRIESLEGEPKRTVTIKGEPDTFFSIPAETRYYGKRLNGYVTSDDNGNYVFRHCYY